MVKEKDITVGIGWGIKTINTFKNERDIEELNKKREKAISKQLIGRYRMRSITKDSKW